MSRRHPQGIITLSFVLLERLRLFLQVLVMFLVLLHSLFSAPSEFHCTSAARFPSFQLFSPSIMRANADAFQVNLNIIDLSIITANLDRLWYRSILAFQVCGPNHTALWGTLLLLVVTYHQSRQQTIQSTRLTIEHALLRTHRALTSPAGPLRHVPPLPRHQPWPSPGLLQTRGIQLQVLLTCILLVQ